jgi:hypothetical protein
MTFVGPLLAKQYGAGSESLDVQLFERAKIPWDEIAFPVVEEALRRYLEDVAHGQFHLHVADMPERSI